MQKYSESSKERETWRTIKSIKLTWDIQDKIILNIWSLWWWYEDRITQNTKYKKLIWLDLPNTLIKELSKQYEWNEKVSFVEWDLTEELPFENNYFDIVSLWEVFEHIKKNKELFGLLEIHRVLKPGGKLLLSTPFADWRSMLLDPMWYFWHRHYTIKEIKYLLHESWFSDYDISVSGWYYELFTMFLLYFFKWVFWREIPFKKFFEEKRKIEFEKKWFTNIFITVIKIKKT